MSDDQAISDAELEAWGLLEPGQPTAASHLRHRLAMTAEFSPLERARIRCVLGLPPSKEKPDD